MDDLTTTVARMAKIGWCGSPSFSPDGQRLAFVSNLTGNPQVWTAPSAGGWPSLVTDLDDQILAVQWSPTGEWLSFDLAPGGGMNRQVYLVRPDGSSLRRLTPGGRDNNWLGRWLPDGRSLYLASSLRTPEAMDAYVLDVNTSEMRLAAQNNGIGQFTGISVDGRWAVLYRLVSRSDSNLYLIDLETGVETLLTPHAGPGTFDFGQFASDGRTIYMVSNLDREMAALGRVRLGADGQPGPLETVVERDNAELELIEFAPDGRVAVLIWNVAGLNEIDFFDPATETVTRGPLLPAEIVFSAAFSSDSRQLALNLTGSTAPADIWVCEIAAGALRQVTQSPHAGIDLAELVSPELLRFSAHDGLGLSGLLYRPRGIPAPFPVVISFHGGPEGQEQPLFNSTYQALLAQGLGVFAPNVRGSSGFGKTFVNLDNGPLRFDALRDIQACGQFLVAQGLAAPGRIGIMGGSYGGYMTMAGLVEYPELFAAGANLFGIVNFETFFAHTEPWMAAISTVEYGDPVTQADLLRRLSPLHKIDRVIAPILVLHGANDTNVPVVEAEQVVASLERRGVPVEYILFADEGHGFLKTENRIRAAVAIVRWFAEYLR